MITVFTNGCFDILHPGHVSFLAKARSLGDYLTVGLNSDESVRRLKGEFRPIFNQFERRTMLQALTSVDLVWIFGDDEPADLVARVLPDILVKGEDWAHYVSGREIVEKNGGKVVLLPLNPSYSTTKVIERIKNAGD